MFPSTAARFYADIPIALRGRSPKECSRWLAVITRDRIALAANQLTNFLHELASDAAAGGGMTNRSSRHIHRVIRFAVCGWPCHFHLDRLGILPVAILFLVGAPLVAMMASSDVSATLVGNIAGAGFCVTGNNFGINAALVMIYPTPIARLGPDGPSCSRVGSLGVLLSAASCWRCTSRNKYVLAPALASGRSVAAGVLAVMCFSGLEVSDLMNRLRSVHRSHSAD